MKYDKLTDTTHSGLSQRGFGVQSELPRAAIKVGTRIDEVFVVTRISGDSSDREYCVVHNSSPELGSLLLRALPETLSSDPGFESNRKELAALGQIKHRNLGPRFIVDDAPELGFYTAREELKGASLEEIFRCGKGFNLQEVCYVLAEAAQAVAELHSRNLIHLNICPASIFITEDGQVKLSLFAMSRVRELHFGKLETLRPICFCAPEELSGSVQSPAVDTYSLGAIAHQFLTGAPPFSAKSMSESKHRIVNEPLPTLESFKPHIPPQLFEFVNAALAKNPDERPRPFESLSEIAPPDFRFRIGPHLGTEPRTGDNPAGPDAPGPERDFGKRVAAGIAWFLPICLFSSVAYAFFVSISVVIRFMATNGPAVMLMADSSTRLRALVSDNILTWWPLALIGEIVLTAFLSSRGELPGTERYIVRKEKKKGLMARSEIPESIYYLCGWPVFICFIGGGVGSLFGAVAAGASIDAYRQTRSVGIAFVLSLFLGDLALLGWLIFTIGFTG